MLESLEEEGFFFFLICTEMAEKSSMLSEKKMHQMCGGAFILYRKPSLVQGNTQHGCWKSRIFFPSWHSQCPLKYHYMGIALLITFPNSDLVPLSYKML